MKPIFIDAVSVYGKGLLSWDHAKEVFNHLERYDATQIPKLDSGYLTPNNLRRTTHHMHIAFQAADMALKGSDAAKERVEFVFATSDVDLDVAESNCLALSLHDKEISPQKFQNVVLNAAAGHLGVFMKNTSGSTTVSAQDNNFAVGFLQAYTFLQVNTGPASQVHSTPASPVNTTPALLVAYDAPFETRHGPGHRPFFCVGMLLTANQTPKSMMSLTPNLVPQPKPTALGHAELEAIRTTAPAAGCLPLLMALAKKTNDTVELVYTEELGLKVSLCNL